MGREPGVISSIVYPYPWLSFRSPVPFVAATPSLYQTVCFMKASLNIFSPPPARGREIVSPRPIHAPDSLLLLCRSVVGVGDSTPGSEALPALIASYPSVQMCLLLQSALVWIRPGGDTYLFSFQTEQGVGMDVENQSLSSCLHWRTAVSTWWGVLHVFVHAESHSDKRQSFS